MKKKYNLLFVGLCTLLTGIVMFVIGAGAFVYLGEPNWFYNTFGGFAFVFWLPTLLLGLVLTILGIRKAIEK